MSKITAVIGAMYGDEGKGLMTDYFTSTANQINPTAVIRYNGGAQAGHTVQLPDGTRHIFSHFGSGTFNNRPTLLSEFFVVHPMLFVKEWQELVDKGYTPDVYIHPDCSITTPYDMIVNQVIENRRGEHRHGSVGIGFGETFERECYMPIKAKELVSFGVNQLREKLILIRDRWVPSRIQDPQNEKEKTIYDALQNDDLLDDFIQKCQETASNAKVLFYPMFANHNLVFEGAQGLMLDQTYGIFPHVTRSNTGCKNIFKILENFGNTEMDIVHCSRLYTTRHGAGPFDFEQPFPDHIIDNTNHSHLFQGDLRYSPLNVDVLLSMIEKDLDEAKQHKQHKINHRVAFTCADQIVDNWPVIYKGKLLQLKQSAMVDFINSLAHYVSSGPTRNDVKVIAR